MAKESGLGLAGVTIDNSAGSGQDIRNDITNFENGPFQRCDDDPDVNGDGRGDFHYMPEPSIMSYCNNPWVLTEADVRGLRNAGYTEASPDDEVVDHGGGDRPPLPG